jgi:hypothetical protein
MEAKINMKAIMKQMEKKIETNMIIDKSEVSNF